MKSKEVFISLLKTINEIKLYFKQDLLNNFEFHEEYIEEYAAENAILELLHKKLSELYVTFLNTERTEEDDEWFKRYFSIHYEGKYTFDSFLDYLHEWIKQVDDCLDTRKNIVKELSLESSEDIAYAENNTRNRFNNIIGKC